MVAPAWPKAKAAEVHRPWQEATSRPSRDLHGPVGAGPIDATRLVRPTPDGTVKGRRRGRRPCAPYGPATEDGREGGQPRATFRKAAVPTTEVLAGRLVTLVPFAAAAEVRLVAVKVMTAGPEGPQAGQVGPASGPIIAATKAEGTATATCLVPVLLPTAIGRRPEPQDGTRRPEAP